MLRASQSSEPSLYEVERCVEGNGDDPIEIWRRIKIEGIDQFSIMLYLFKMEFDRWHIRPYE
jgi:hypothetical protein